MAHRKAGGTAKNLKDSNPQYLGVKLFAGEVTKPGAIIIRQRGTKFHPGENVAIGKDDTLYAKVAGVVKFQEKKVVAFTGNKSRRMFVSVETVNKK